MSRPTGRRPVVAPARLAAALIALACALSPPARAQLSAGGGPGGGLGGAGGHGAPGGGSSEEKKLAPPPAIPGAVSANGAAPATRPASEMDPDAALFDAIDRGDLAAARDALNRGADLNARNVLGQRPVDMSIDLSRNDITFLLLSLRAQNGDQAPAATEPDEAAATDAPPAAQPASDEHRRRGRAHRAAPAPAPAVTADVSTPAPASDPGFLGFGGR